MASSQRGLTRLEIAAIIVGFLALNIAGAVIYKVKFKAPPAPPQVTSPPTPTPVADVDQDKFRAYRGAGLTALSQGDYETAVEQFTQALRFGRADSDIMELLKMAKEFQEKKTEAKPAPVEVAAAPTTRAEPAPAPAPPRPAAKAPAKREPPRPAPRPEPREKEPKEKEEVVAVAPQPATLLITSSPTGLVVEVDGARKDLTPAKVAVTAGSHVVSLWKGEARLFQKTVTAEAGQVALVDADLADKVAAAEPKSQPVAPAVVAAAPVAPPPAPVEKVKPPEPPPVPTPAPTSPVAEAATGELQIQSLNVYGEVFVNGKSVGFPPVVAKGIPAAQATIEVKVDGSVRRKRVVDVVANKRTTVRIP